MTHDPGRSDPPAESQPSRRTILQRAWLWATVGVGGIAAAALGVPVVGFLFGPLRKKPEEWINLGPISKFPIDQTRLVTFDNPIRQPWDGQVADTGVYVRYEGLDDDKQPRFLILAVNCTHLGCPVSWFAQSGLFMCPCHGGVYYSTGERASGPPPRGLFHYDWRVRDGHLEVQAPHYPTLQDPLLRGEDKGKA
jgi:menaquinol-cytochrome c reductase iron-sulfur subunit